MLVVESELPQHFIVSTYRILANSSSAEKTEYKGSVTRGRLVKMRSPWFKNKKWKKNVSESSRFKGQASKSFHVAKGLIQRFMLLRYMC